MFLLVAFAKNFTNLLFGFTIRRKISKKVKFPNHFSPPIFHSTPIQQGHAYIHIHYISPATPPNATSNHTQRSSPHTLYSYLRHALLRGHPTVRRPSHTLLSQRLPAYEPPPGLSTLKKQATSTPPSHYPISHSLKRAAP